MRHQLQRPEQSLGMIGPCPSLPPSGPRSRRSSRASLIGHGRRRYTLVIDRDWSGGPAPAALATTARLLWTVSHLSIGFECRYAALDVDAAPRSTPRSNAWPCGTATSARRSCRRPTNRGPTATRNSRWRRPAREQPGRSTARGSTSIGAGTAAWPRRQASTARRTAVRCRHAIPFAAFGVTPARGDGWRVNLFRIGRVDGVRHYLELRPDRHGHPRLPCAGVLGSAGVHRRLTLCRPAPALLLRAGRTATLAAGVARQEG